MYKQYINGKLVDGAGKPMDVFNPATGEIVGTVGCADKNQTTEALKAAQTAFKTWSKTSVNERADWLYKLKDACLKERDTLIDLVSAESGRPYPAACGDVDWLLISLSYYAEEAKRIEGEVMPALHAGDKLNYQIVTKQPVGVTVGHVAWNYPLGNASIKLAPAVASGCTCIIKPSSQTPLATLYVGEIAEKIGFPAGVINILSGPSGEVAKTLNESDIPRMISLIGSYETGIKLMQQGSRSLKKYSLELGGNAPVVVMPDADIEETAANIVAKKVGFAGQTCVNYNRIYIHESIYDVMCEKIAQELKKVKLGKGKDEGYIMGPVINAAARDRMLELIDDAVEGGARLVMGGEVPEEFKKGSYITPALLIDVNDDMRVSKEEIFGPIIPLQSFKTLDEAIEKSNNTIFGLSAYFFGHNSKEMSRYFEGVRAGEIFVNGGIGSEFSPHAGAKQSGIGCDKSKHSLAEYYDIKFLSMIP
ncbi:MAG: aldehyde dehydrogenase family protein [Clostridiales bacterium]|nr:aldehyde dehydrogenase family protein [Clostridiales bacterium]